jgi:C4-dicarboxylate-specific signal transduction histidine kinase
LLHFKHASISYTPGLPADVKVIGNTGGLQHVLSILIENAQQAIADMHQREPDKVHQNLPITISAEAKEHWVEVHVHNHGTKISKQRASQLFDYPVVDPATHREGRNGVGLLLSKVLLSKYGGTIALSKNSDKAGVRFTIRLKRSN